MACCCARTAPCILQQCTPPPHPLIRACACPPPLSPSDPAGLGARLAALAAGRAASLEAARRAAEYAALAECTFAPATLAGRPQGGAGAEVEGCAPVTVRGLGRFLELRGLSRQLEEDAR